MTKEKAERLIGVQIIEWVMTSKEYEHRVTYWTLKELLPHLIRKGHHKPAYAPSICCRCLTLHEDKVLGGKLWMTCPLCNGWDSVGGTDILQTPQDRKRLELHSDVYALLAPYLPSWKIDQLLCIYYSHHPDLYKPLESKKPNIAPIL